MWADRADGLRMSSVHPDAVAEPPRGLEFEPIELPTPPDEARAPGEARVPGRRWTSLPIHAALLALLLAILVPLLDDGSMMSADEGAMLAQLEVLDTSAAWALPNPYPEVDPEGRWFGFEKSDRSGDEFYPYAKHAVYPATMRPLFALGGQRAVLFASAFGTWCAAVLAARLARRIDRRLDVPTLWVVGVVSPVFFDSFWVIAHSIGAAFATGATVAAVAAIVDRRWRYVVPAFVALVGAAWFRSEGVLFALSLGVGAGLVAMRPVLAERRLRSVDRIALVIAGSSAVAGVAARAVDARLSGSIVGETVEPFQIASGSTSWLAGRLQGVWSSVLRPQLMDPTAAGGIFLMIALLGIVGAVYVRRSPHEVALIRTVAAAAIALALVAVWFRKAPVPGLLVAFPLLPVGVILLRRPAWSDTTTRLVVGTAAVFCLAVLVTQYSIGGSMEWGGRYFHLALPVVVPVLLASIRAAGATLDRTTARLGATALAVVSAVLLVFSVGTVTRLHDATKPLVDGVIATAESTGQQRPIVVTNMEALARLTWRQSTHARYLAVPESEELTEVAERLRSDGVEEFVFASAWEHDEDRALLVGYEPRPGRTVRVAGWRISLMRVVG